MPFGLRIGKTIFLGMRNCNTSVFSVQLNTRKIRVLYRFVCLINSENEWPIMVADYVEPDLIERLI